MKRSHAGTTLFPLCLLLVTLAWAPLTRAAQPPLFTDEQLEQLVAPIALYPDALVSQVLMASTYPLEVVEAHRWLQANRQLSDEVLELQAAQYGWDPSVVSLLHFPGVLARMNEDLRWLQDLGDAVLTQQADVLDAVQRMRRLAYEEGNLQDTPQQQIVVEDRIIRIVPATSYIFVPAYNPLVVYGPGWHVSYRYYPYFGYPIGYWYPSGYYSGTVVSFGFGLALGVAIWGDIDWYDHHLHYHHHHHHWHGHPRPYAGQHPPGKGKPVWHHNPWHRRNVRYRSPAVREKVVSSWEALDLPAQRPERSSIQRRSDTLKPPVTSAKAGPTPARDASGRVSKPASRATPRQESGRSPQRRTQAPVQPATRRGGDQISVPTQERASGRAGRITVPDRAPSVRTVPGVERYQRAPASQPLRATPRQAPAARTVQPRASRAAPPDASRRMPATRAPAAATSAPRPSVSRSVAPATRAAPRSRMPGASDSGGRSWSGRNAAPHRSASPYRDSRR
jgi:hypothetical protein